MMKSFRTGLITLVAGLCAFHGVQTQTMAATQLAQSESRDFASDRWSHFTVGFKLFAGVRGESNADDLLLLGCVERDSSLALSFHPADRAGLSEDAVATLVFDGGKAIEAGMRGSAILNNLLFLMPDRDPNFQLVIEKLMSSKALEIVIVESGTAQTRHSFTLNGADDAIEQALRLCRG
jgi:hypothetical protein